MPEATNRGRSFRVRSWRVERAILSDPAASGGEWVISKTARRISASVQAVSIR
jgi:hypothetical protein